ncbi:MAG: thioredoxin family protein [Myxococcota bacterium]|nr:thioredoxin family protein [Myxococcota bacterium]
MSSTSIKQINKLNLEIQKEALESLQKDPAKLLQSVLPKDAFDANPAIQNSQPLILPDNLKIPQFEGIRLAAKNVSLVTSGPGAAAPATKFTHKNWDKAIAHAAETGKPLVVKVGASWCGPCHAMNEKVLKNPELQKRLEKEATFVSIEIDGRGETGDERDDADDIAKDLGVRAYPSVYILTLENKNGKPKFKAISTNEGYLSVNGFNQLLDARNNGLKVAAQGIKDAGFGPSE